MKYIIICQVQVEQLKELLILLETHYIFCLNEILINIIMYVGM